MMTKKTIENIAKTAKLDLSEKEIENFTKELNSILTAFRNMNKINTKNTKPSFHPIKIKNSLRKDKTKKSITQKQALSNVKTKENGFIKGPRAV